MTDAIIKALMVASFVGIFVNIVILCAATLTMHELALLWLLNVADLCIILDKIQQSKPPVRLTLFIILGVAHIFFVPICIIDQSNAVLVIWFLLHFINFGLNAAFTAQTMSHR